MKLSLSILNADLACPLAVIQGLADLVDYVHFDVMDGHFVPNLTFGPLLPNALREKIALPFDIHLMVDRPALYAPRFAVRPGDVITFHVEALDPPDAGIEAVRKLGCRVGLSLRPRTPLSLLAPYLDQIDWVLVMSVEPGFGGQSFLPESLGRIAQLRRMIGDRPIQIAVDGGLGPENVAEVLRAGAEVIVAGAAIFRAKNPREAALNLWKAAGLPRT
ncbi:MAG: ribulose-phosphate 3-epimerase [Candidatus Bipolaricaulota bacterium]|nr:ribulose-phosphate 3-epimerase [Candidatus Bipolaricaulota bacterium]